MMQKIICQQQNLLGESPIWHPLENCLYWLDIFGKKIYKYLPQLGEIFSIDVPYLTGCIAPHSHGGLIAGMKNGIALVDPEKKSFEIIVELFDSSENIRINDGKCDPAGRFWLGTVATDQQQPNGKLYRYDPDGTLTVMQDKVGISNGLAWDIARKRFYYNDSGLDRTMWCYDYCYESGDISNRRKFFPNDSFPQAIPDGMAIDSQGNIWCACWEGGCVICLNPHGEMIKQIGFDTPRITSCVFGGDNLSTLYVTSCSKDQHEKESLPFPAGALFEVHLDEVGLATDCFG